MGNQLSRYRRRNRYYHRPVPPSSGPTSVSTSRAHGDDGSTQSQPKATVPENKESQTILTYQDQLVNAISPHNFSIAGVLRECEFISDEDFGKMLHPSSTPQEKAIIQVNAVREKIKGTPKRFPELIRVFSEQVSTKNVAGMLQSAYQDRSKLYYACVYSILNNICIAVS